MVPPGHCLPTDRPVARILAASIDSSDVSRVPFEEVWLLLGVVPTDGDELRWYSLSHAVSDGGDVFLGREVFGHASRSADVRIEGGRVVGRRTRRTFLDLTVDLDAPGAATSAAIEVVVGVQKDSLNAGLRSGRLVTQPWTLDVAWRDLDPARVELSLPDAAGPAKVGYPDPWFELDGEVIAARIGDGSVAFGPGTIVTELDDAWPLVRERFDGTISIPAITEQGAFPTFRLDQRPERPPLP